ncbi:MAG TPA: MlaD family protein [Alphaproteobacteria bacterium]
METRASYFLVGIFVLTLIVGMIGFAFWLARPQIQDDSTYYYVYFRGSVTGLSVGSPVRYRGVPVGTVAGIEIDAENVELIEVTLALRPGTPIKTDTIASLRPQGVTGLSFVQLSGGTQAAPLLEPRPGKLRGVIPSVPSPIEQVFENTPELLSRLSTVAMRANDLLNAENQQRIGAILDNFATFSGALARSSGAVERTAADISATTADLRATVAAVKSLAVELDDLIRQIDPKVGKVATDADAAMTDMRAAARSFARLGRNLDRLVAENGPPIRDFTNSGLYDFSQLIAETRTLVATLSQIAYRLERDPARFLFGDQQKGFEAR